MALPKRRYIRNMWRRHIIGITYHIGLTVFVTIAVLKMAGVSQFPDADELEGVGFRKRAVDIAEKISKTTATIVEIADDGPFVRVADEPVSDWIQLKKQRAIGYGDDEGLLKSRISNHLRDSIKSLEVLGEGGSHRDLSRKDRVLKNLKIAKQPELPDARDIPISKDLKRRIMDENNKNKKTKVDSAATNLTISAQLERHIQNIFMNQKQSPVEEKQTPREAELDVQKDASKALSDKEDMVLAPSSKLSNDKQLLPPSQTKSKRLNVLILAAMRTGSSFLGEMFQQRKDFFYMFEPGRLLMHKLDELRLTRGVMVTKLIQMLDKFYRCSFQDMHFFIDRLNEDTLRGRKQAVPALVTDQFCTLHEFELFKFHRPKDECQTVTEGILETACTGRAHTAIKSIRILDMNHMLKAVEEPQTNLKLIHLVRDPRSMILSRLKLAMPHIQVFNTTELSVTYRNVLMKYCSSWHQNYEIGHYVPFVRKNYLLVRYEDIARDPYRSARKIYNFVGLGVSIPSSVRTWIGKNTNVNDQSKKKSMSFSTKRDSKSVLVSWKSKLTLQMAKAIEEVGECTRLMQATGYKLIGNDPLMLSNSDTLVGPLPPPRVNVTEFGFL